MVKQGSTQQSEQVAWVQGQTVEQILAMINMNFSILTRKFQTLQTGSTGPGKTPSLISGIIHNLVITTGTDHETTQLKDTYLEFEWDSLGGNYSYNLQLRKAGSTNKWRKFTIAPEFETRASCRVDNCKAGRWLEFRIRAVSSFGTMSEWLTGEYQTALDTPDHVDFIITGGGDAECNWNHQYPWLYWDEIADENDIQFYEIRVANIDWGVKNATFVHRSLEGFFEVTNYYKKWPTDTSKTFYVKARNYSGQWASTPGSVTLTINTPTMAGYTPVVAYRVGERLKVKWGDWTGFGVENVKKYQIWYSTNPAFDAIITDGSAIRDGGVDAGTEQHIIDNLNPALTYYVRIKPIGWLADGVQSEVVTAAP